MEMFTKLCAVSSHEQLILNTGITVNLSVIFSTNSSYCDSGIKRAAFTGVFCLCNLASLED